MGVTGPPEVPVPAEWREVAPHEVRWSVWTPKDAVVSGVEAVVVTPGAAQAEPVACDPDANASTQTRSYWSCSLLARQGPRTVRARAVNASGASAWEEVEVTFTRGSCTDAVAAAGACEEFDTGPGGGFVFYDAGSRQSWGQYLEAAPAGWMGDSGDPYVVWCQPEQPGYNSTLATSEGIGSGAANTRLIIENCGTDSAAGVSAAYRGGGKSDWFHASKDELNRMYDRRTEIGIKLRGKYARYGSSSQAAAAREAEYQDLIWGDQYTFPKEMTGLVRPIRAS
jgi:hypothetical protein